MTLYNLPLQNKLMTNKDNHYYFENDHPSEVLLGYVWDKINDTLLPNVTISHGRKGKGIKGIELTDKPFNPVTITKRVLLSVLQQLYDPLGIYLDPHKIGLKIIYSRVCLLMSGRDAKSFNSPIFNVSTELAQKASDACNELISIKQIKPMKRATVPKGHNLKYLVLSKDGSTTAHSSLN